MSMILDIDDPEGKYQRDAFGTLLTDSSTPALASTNSSKRTGDYLSKIGLFTSVIGGINSALGNYYAAKTAQYQAKSRASSYQFASDMEAINASAAESDAQSILEAGKSQIANYTMEAGQRKASAKTSMAARGMVLGEGSTRDVEASMDLVKDMDVLTINSNAVRAAEAQRRQGQNFRNQATVYGVSARNASMSSRSISPFASMTISLLSSASTIASQWRWQQQGD